MAPTPLTFDWEGGSVELIEDWPLALQEFRTLIIQRSEIPKFATLSIKYKIEGKPGWVRPDNDAQFVQKMLDLVQQGKVKSVRLSDAIGSKTTGTTAKRGVAHVA